MKDWFKLSPITSSMAFLEIDIENILREFMLWQAPLVLKYGNSLEKISQNKDLETAFLSLCPLNTVERRRFLFIPTKSSWVAFLDNGHVGTDRTIPEVLANKLNVRSVYISHDWETEETTFDYYSTNGEGIELSRSIAVIKESNWEFHQYGAPLPFENVENYKIRQIKKRFDFPLLKEYLSNLGINAFDESFYNSEKSILVKKIGRKFPETRELTLEESQSFFKS